MHHGRARRCWGSQWILTRPSPSELLQFLRSPACQWHCRTLDAAAGAGAGRCAGRSCPVATPLAPAAITCCTGWVLQRGAPQGGGAGARQPGGRARPVRDSLLTLLCAAAGRPEGRRWQAAKGMMRPRGMSPHATPSLVAVHASFTPGVDQILCCRVEDPEVPMLSSMFDKHQARPRAAAALRMRSATALESWPLRLRPHAFCQHVHAAACLPACLVLPHGVALATILDFSRQPAYWLIAVPATPGTPSRCQARRCARRRRRRRWRGGPGRWKGRPGSGGAIAPMHATCVPPCCGGKLGWADPKRLSSLAGTETGSCARRLKKMAPSAE